MNKGGLLFGLVLSLAVFLSSCATDAPLVKKARPGVQRDRPLRIGVTPVNPPYMYKQGTEIVGIEADLGRRLGEALKRPVQFVEVAGDELIPSLLDGRIDIIMSGMVITKARQVRMAFSDAYMRSSLVAAVARGDADRFHTKADILGSQLTVGVVKGTAADAFVTQHMPSSDKQDLKKISDAVTYFDQNRIRIFIADLCAVAWLVSENEAVLAGVWTPLQEQEMGWALPNDDAELRQSVNAILAGWKKDGALEKVLKSHVPFLDRLPWQAP